MTKNVAVVLSGCGVYDGSEPYETVLTLFFLDQAGVKITCLAPEKNIQPVNHLSGETLSGEQRNTLVEAARLVRGEIADLKTAKPETFDALIVPGGFGAAKNLCDFATAGADCSVEPSFLRFAQSLHEAGKPVGLMCIAPAMAPHIFGRGISCTIGNDAHTASLIEAMGGKHVECAVSDIHTDKTHKLVTTPAYMLATRVSEAARGIEKLVNQVLALCA